MEVIAFLSHHVKQVMEYDFCSVGTFKMGTFIKVMETSRTKCLLNIYFYHLRS